jgi:glycogenin glucosyltransferase
MKSSLGEVFDLVKEVDIFDSKDEANLRLMARPELGVTFTKLHCWRLTQFSKAVFMDADTLVLQNSDELFDREELSAAPDIGWPDCFNSGVFVYRPNNDTYEALIQMALTQGSFDGGDQGILNQYFSDWATKDISKHLPFIYNMTSSVAYTYSPAYQRFGSSVKIVHFLGGVKPWATYYNPSTQSAESTGQYASEHLAKWWSVFLSNVHPKLSSEMTGLAGQLAELSIVEGQVVSGGPSDSRARQTAWETGQIDYMGQDAFSNIQKKLDEAMTQPQAAASVAAPEAPAAPTEQPPQV